MKHEISNPLLKILYDKEKVLELIEKSLNENDGFLITYFNQHCFNIYYSDLKYRDLLINNYQYYYDGIGVWFFVSLIFRRWIKRFNASEINENIFNYLVENKTPFILIGGKFEKNILQNSSLNISLYFNGYSDIKNQSTLIKKIKESETNVVIIGTGVPLQEFIGFSLFNEKPDLKIICVGNFMEFFFGTVKRAPKFLQNSGFEWLFRIMVEPRRLWKRYFLGIPLFFYRIIKIILFGNDLN